MVYPKTMTLQTTGAQVIHDPSEGASVQNWYGKMVIESISANTLQLQCVTGSGAWNIYNYISLDYYNSH
jgi:hypothetical protein